MTSVAHKTKKNDMFNKRILQENSLKCRISPYCTIIKTAVQNCHSTHSKTYNASLFLDLLKLYKSKLMDPDGDPQTLQNKVQWDL